MNKTVTPEKPELPKRVVIIEDVNFRVLALVNAIAYLAVFGFVFGFLFEYTIGVLK